MADILSDDAVIGLIFAAQLNEGISDTMENVPVKVADFQLS